MLLESLTFGDDVIKLFARYVIYDYPFVTPLGFRVIVYPFDFGLGMCWGCIEGCIGWNWEAFKIFWRWEIGVNWRLLWGLLEARLGWIWEKF